MTKFFVTLIYILQAGKTTNLEQVLLKFYKTKAVEGDQTCSSLLVTVTFVRGFLLNFMYNMEIPVFPPLRVK